MSLTHALQIFWEFHVEMVPDDDYAERLHVAGERLMDELGKLQECNPRVLDPAVSTEADRGVALVELIVLGDYLPDALDEALAVVRSAIHAAGGYTPDWPTVDELRHHPAFRAGLMRTEPVPVPAAA